MCGQEEMRDAKSERKGRTSKGHEEAKDEERKEEKDKEEEKPEKKGKKMSEIKVEAQKQAKEVKEACAAVRSLLPLLGKKYTY